MAAAGPLEVSALDFRPSFLVWALRAWVQAFKSGDSFDAVTQHGFTRFGLQASVLALDGAMTVLAASASRAIDIRCMNCRYLSPMKRFCWTPPPLRKASATSWRRWALRKIMPGTAAASPCPYGRPGARPRRAGMRLNSAAVTIADRRPRSTAHRRHGSGCIDSSGARRQRVERSA